jgi:aminoglycoside phosphotransferase (APT) family kinase protein
VAESEPEIDAALARKLVAEQFPKWSGLPVVPVPHGGWDNRTFRLGESMSVRLPSADGYAEQVAKEQRWLPILAPELTLPIPRPLAVGESSSAFARPWSIYEWIDGEVAELSRIVDLAAFATDIAEFLVALRGIDATRGPKPGAHNFFRGASPRGYDSEARGALIELGDSIDAVGARAVWDAAVMSEWESPPVWFHGDISLGNLLLENGRLSAVIDFGTCGVGDPACDLAIAFTTLDDPSRQIFRSAIALDDATWVRGRGWALWKALIVAAGWSGTHSPARQALDARRVIDVVIADHVAAARS